MAAAEAWHNKMAATFEILGKETGTQNGAGMHPNHSLPYLIAERSFFHLSAV